jgi:hypothetical protein
MFFKEFPTIFYNFRIGNKNVLRAVKDITINVRVRNEVLKNLTRYSEYTIQDGDTPERIAERYYGNANYHWVIMLANEKFDYISDFPLTNDQLLAHTIQKYGEGNVHNQHQIFGTPHFETPDKQIVDGDFPEARPISNYEYEFDLNEKKRNIKIIAPSIVGQIVNELKELV